MRQHQRIQPRGHAGRRGAHHGGKRGAPRRLADRAVGDGALVIDEDSGNLILTDALARNTAYLAIGRGAGLLVFDPASRLAYVADRRGNRIAVVRVGRALEIVRDWPTPVEPYGVALAPDRRTLLVTAIADRAVIAYDAATGEEQWRAGTGPEPRGIAIAPDGAHAAIAFHASDRRLSASGELACATCHPEGRSDGLSWSSENQLRQTPLLAGRVAGTQPFKWDGSEPTLRASVLATVTQLGGRGADAPTIDQLTAYLEAMPPIAAPSRDAAAVARGRRVFDVRGCNDCHDGARYTDRSRHPLRGGLPSDTPSLLGLAASAPYYHDGSAATLEVVLRGGGKVHMTDARLTDREIADLTTFLETL